MRTDARIASRKSYKLLGALIALLALLARCAPQALGQDFAGAVPGEVVVGLNPAADNAATQLVLAAYAQIKEQIPDLHAYLLSLPSGIRIGDAIAHLTGMFGVDYAEPNWLIWPAGAPPNDTYYSSQQYAPQAVHADVTWPLWQPSAKVILAIEDSGIDYNHPDLSAKMITGKDFSGTNSTLDDYGHGTHVAGIAAAAIDNSVGIAGISGWNGRTGFVDTYTEIMPVKVLNAGSGNDMWLAVGIDYAVQQAALQNARLVINMSLQYMGSTNGGSNVLNNAVAAAWNGGSGNSVLIACAGNGGQSSPVSYPGAYPGVISVANTDSNEALYYQSNWGWPIVAAPGVNIYSTVPEYGVPQFPGSGNPKVNNPPYGTETGTSMSCAVVSGEAALIWAQRPDLTPLQVYNLIVNNVDPIYPYVDTTQNPPVTRTMSGGQVDLYKALPCVSTLWQAVAVCDINQDGKADIIFQNRESGDLGYWLMNGANQTANGLFSPSFPGDGRWRLAAMGSLNGPSFIPYAVFQYGGSGSLSYWQMGWSGSTFEKTASGLITPANPGDPSWKLMGMGKFHSASDYQQDLVFEYLPQLTGVYSNPGNVAIWQMSGVTETSSSLTTPNNMGSSDDSWLVAGTPNLNGSSQNLSDLLWQNQSTGNLDYWYMNGALQTGSGTINPSNPGDPNWILVGSGDFNGDGHPDLLFQHRISGNLAIWFMNGINQTSAVLTNPSNPG
ncbi:MAG TPA: S8 family serine peptidase [Chthonomonadales bacterium]|nr:S8 family serine peptidase [Chthonomonadales bacterium]